MNLTEFNRKNVSANIRVKQGKPKVYLTKQGYVIVNLNACKVMGLKAGDLVAITQDVDAPENWYIHKSENGFALCEQGNRGLRFMRKSLVKAIVQDCFGWDADETYTFRLAPPTEVDDKMFYGMIIC